MKLNHSSANLPFSIICSKTNGTDFEFIVNFGSVNSFIFGTDKRFVKNFGALTGGFGSSINFDPPVGDEVLLEKLKKEENGGLIRSAPVSQGKYIYKTAQKLEKTFVVTSSCSVYLSIPKVPWGFDARKYNFKRLWFYLDRYSFANQFKIETNKDDGFMEKFNENQRYIEKNNPFFDTQDPSLVRAYFSKPFQSILSDEEYPGKFYIKLADINIKGSSYNINYFFRSNLIAPIRFLRIPNLMRSFFNIYVDLVGLGEPNELGGVSFYEVRYSVNWHPRFLLKTIDQLKGGDAETIMADYTTAEIEKTGMVFSEAPTIYRIIFVYIQSADGKTVIEVAKDDVSDYNSKRKKHSQSNNLQIAEPKQKMSREDVIKYFFPGKPPPDENLSYLEIKIKG